MEIKIAKKQCFIAFKLIISILFTFIDIPVYNNLNKVYHTILLGIKILKIIKEVKIMDINIKMNKIIGFMLSHYKRIKISSVDNKFNSILISRQTKNGFHLYFYHCYINENKIHSSHCYVRNKKAINSEFKYIKL